MTGSKFLYCFFGVMAGLALGISPAMADVDYTIGGTYVSSPNPGNGTPSSADLEYFNINIGAASETGLAGDIVLTPGGSSPGPSVLNTVCVDLNGTLYLGQTYAFKGPELFNNAGTGLEPNWGSQNASSLTSVANATAALQNAAYVYNQYSYLLTTGTLSQKAAVQLAVWAALYNTTADTLGGENGLSVSSGRFNITGGDSTAIADANSYLASIPTAFTAYQGYLLEPDPTVQYGSTGQGVFDTVTPVPEPTTIIGGALLLLPLAGSALRAWRKKQMVLVANC